MCSQLFLPADLLLEDREIAEDQILKLNQLTFKYVY